MFVTSGTGSLFASALLAMLCVLSVTAKLTPRSLSHRSERQSLAVRSDDAQQGIPINNAEYEKLCGENSPKTHPCFTNWWSSVSGATFTRGSELHMYAKDDKMMDFTLSDPTQAFSVEYSSYQSHPRLLYSNYDAKTGCYDITISIDGFCLGDRIWVSDEDGSDRDLDTWKRTTSTKRFCTKWLHIHVKNDGQDLDDCGA